MDLEKQPNSEGLIILPSSEILKNVITNLINSEGDPLKTGQKIQREIGLVILEFNNEEIILPNFLDYGTRGKQHGDIISAHTVRFFPETNILMEVKRDIAEIKHPLWQEPYVVSIPKEKQKEAIFKILEGQSWIKYAMPIVDDLMKIEVTQKKLRGENIVGKVNVSKFADGIYNRH